MLTHMMRVKRLLGSRRRPLQAFLREKQNEQSVLADLCVHFYRGRADRLLVWFLADFLSKRERGFIASTEYGDYRVFVVDREAGVGEVMMPNGRVYCNTLGACLRMAADDVERRRKRERVEVRS